MCLTNLVDNVVLFILMTWCVALIEMVVDLAWIQTKCGCSPPLWTVMMRNWVLGVGPLAGTILLYSRFSKTKTKRPFRCPEK